MLPRDLRPPISAEGGRSSDPSPPEQDPGPASERQHALEHVLADLERDGVEVRFDEEANAYLDFCARMQGIEPDQVHAVSLGEDLIMVRREHASNVRVLREEWIHTRQSAAGQVSTGADGGSVLDNEIRAREIILENRNTWCITAEEVAEIEEEIRIMRERGRY